MHNLNPFLVSMRVDNSDHSDDEATTITFWYFIHYLILTKWLSKGALELRFIIQIIVMLV